MWFSSYLLLAARGHLINIIYQNIWYIILDIVNCFTWMLFCIVFASAAVTSRGELYTWGRGNYGRLGHGNSEDVNLPTLVVGLKGKLFECFYVMTLCVVCVYVCETINIGYYPNHINYRMIF